MAGPSGAPHSGCTVPICLLAVFYHVDHQHLHGIVDHIRPKAWRHLIRLFCVHCYGHGFSDQMLSSRLVSSGVHVRPGGWVHMSRGADSGTIGRLGSDPRTSQRLGRGDPRTSQRLVLQRDFRSQTWCRQAFDAYRPLGLVTYVAGRLREA